MYEDRERAHQRGDSTSSIPGSIGIQNIGFRGEGKTGVPKENHSEQRREPTTNSITYGVNTRIWTQATLVGGECFHHCTTLAPPHKRLTLRLQKSRFFLKISKEIDNAWRKSSRACEARIPSLIFIKLPRSDVHTVDQCLRCGYRKWKMKWCNPHNKKMMVSSARMSKTILLCTEHIVHTIPRYLMISEWSISHK